MEEKEQSGQGTTEGDETPRTTAVQSFDHRVPDQRKTDGEPIALDPDGDGSSKETRHRAQSVGCDEDSSDVPMAKKFKPMPTAKKADSVSRGGITPGMVTESTDKTPKADATAHDDSSDSLLDKKMPAAGGRESASAGSVSPSSDISSASSSHSQRKSGVSSPVPTSGYTQEVPPAPPSTPASHPNTTVLLDMGLATPLPFQEGVRNAFQLEQQQILSEGAETPAPKADSSEGRVLSMTEDFSEWAVGDRYELIRILGRGSYGEVAQAVDKWAGRADAYVAIKRILSPFDQEIDAVRLYREIHILRHVRGHSCIINLLDIVQPPTDDLDDFHDLYLVFECKLDLCRLPSAVRMFDI